MDSADLSAAEDLVIRYAPERVTCLERIVCALLRAGDLRLSPPDESESFARELVQRARHIEEEMLRTPTTPPKLDAHHIIMTRSQFEHYLRRAISHSGLLMRPINSISGMSVSGMTAHLLASLEKVVNG